MLKLWLADKVIDAVGDEHDLVLKRDAIEVVQIIYKTAIVNANTIERRLH